MKPVAIRRLTASACTLGLATAGLALVAPSANATDEYPESEGYSRVNDRFTLPAGAACDGPVIVHFTGYQRFVLNGKVVPVDTDFDLNAGDVLLGTYPEQRVTVTNKQDRSQHVGRWTDGPAVEHVRKNGLDEDVAAWGKNVGFGNGVEGIVWTAGPLRYVVKNFKSEDYMIRIKTVPPVHQELCSQVGLHPVDPAA